jgi:retron-type reverse transcriptase
VWIVASSKPCAQQLNAGDWLTGKRGFLLGIAALEDKILQRAVGEVLGAIYETDFLGFSYGFRPGRSPHHASDALAAGITGRKVNWVLDVDFSDYCRGFDLSVRG